jgi:hypothetical protein
MSKEADFHLHGIVISRTFDTGQMQILTNFTNIPFMTQNLLFHVLFGPEESTDPTSYFFEDEEEKAITVTS